MTLIYLGFRLFLANVNARIIDGIDDFLDFRGCTPVKFPLIFVISLVLTLNGLYFFPKITNNKAARVAMMLPKMKGALMPI